MSSNRMDPENVKLTQFSHGAGCGCKIAPAVLSEMLRDNETGSDFDRLLVGNNSRDDAAVLDLGNGTALISTTDFFMPVVDDPYDFGRIAATNAISDVYAMGGKPILAIAVLGWPVDQLPPSIAGRVIAGGRAICEKAGIPLAGGHSIDSPEPIFGLAVNGLVQVNHLKRNNTARVGDHLFLTKPLGIGILTTALKKNLLSQEDLDLAIRTMTTLNRAGEALGRMEGVHSLTDVTGFGLLGHLTEMAEGSSCSAEIHFNRIPLLSPVTGYLEKGCIPGGTHRNWSSYGDKIGALSVNAQMLLADPQTSGGLLVAVAPEAILPFQEQMQAFGLEPFATVPIGTITEKGEKAVVVIE